MGFLLSAIIYGKRFTNNGKQVCVPKIAFSLLANTIIIQVYSCVNLSDYHMLIPIESIS